MVSYGSRIFYVLNDLTYAGTAAALFTWPDVAERLRYREDEPYCYIAHGYDGSLVCEPPMYAAVERPLHRLAAIICDGAEEFRVLHWCLSNLGSEK